MATPSDKPPRVAIRKGATSEGVAAELVSLLEGITHDGVITDEEIEQLKRWLDFNQDATLPSIEFLRTIVGEILRDNVVTEQERKALHTAVEKVLPTDLRQIAKARRQGVELASKAAAKDELARKKDQAAAAKIRNQPAFRADFMVAGVPYEGRGAIIDQYLQVGATVHLLREPSNPHDANAIVILTEHGYKVGYVPRDDAAAMARFLDCHFKQTATCKKILQGKIAPIPVIDAVLYRPESDAPSVPVPTPRAIPPSLPSSGGTGAKTSSSGAGCMVLLLSVVVLLLALRML